MAIEKKSKIHAIHDFCSVFIDFKCENLLDQQGEIKKAKCRYTNF